VERFAAQALAGPPLADPAAVAERLLAVQGQDPRGFRLAVRARTSGLTAADVERALGEERSLIVTWLNRGTLHLVRSEDYPWLQALTTPPLSTSSARRLRQEGVSEAQAERGLATIERALAELARRYLAGHQPAGDRDLAKWAGLPLRDARAGLKAIASELEEGEDGLLRLRKRPSPEELPHPRLLGAFDPVLLGWTSREPILGAHESRVVSGGLCRPFALAGGRAVAGWKWDRGKVSMQPYTRLPKRQTAALEADAADVASFLGSG
jgi:hypothetical protein